MSNIDTTLIDAGFPNPRIDNDSQGFRTNFNSIKANLNTAKDEISLLQTTVEPLPATVASLASDVLALQNITTGTVSTSAFNELQSTVTNHTSQLATISPVVSSHSTQLAGLTQPVVYVTTPPLSPLGATGDKKGMVHFATSATYFCAADFNGISNIWTKVNVSISW